MPVSDWSNSAGSTTRVSGTWIQDAINPSGVVLHYRYGGKDRQESRDRAKTAMQLAGRAYPIFEVGEARAFSVQVAAQINGEDDDAPQQITLSQKFGEDAQVVLYRDGFGRSFYGMISDFQLTNVGMGHADVSFLVSRVDYDPALPGIT